MDASGTALGAIRLRGRETHNYASKKLSAAEPCYSTTERKCLVIWQGVELFKYYFLRRCFVLKADHAALKWLQASKTDMIGWHTGH